MTTSFIATLNPKSTAQKMSKPNAPEQVDMIPSTTAGDEVLISLLVVNQTGWFWAKLMVGYPET